MKKLILSFFLLTEIIIVQAQNCIPDPLSVLEGPGVYPDSLVGLPPAYTCQFYSAVITVVVPYDTIIDLGGGPFSTIVDSAVLKSVDDLPPNFSYSCEPPDCNFPGGTAGCILLSGLPDPADVGQYVPVGNVFGYIDTFPGIPLPFPKIDYYIIDISLYGGPVISSITNSFPISCSGNCNGELTALGACGFPPYSYSWSNGQTTQTISGLCAGNFSVTVSDSSGSSSANFTLSEPAPLTLGFIQDGPTNGCNGNILVNPSGGTAPYSYVWTTGDTTQAVFSLCSGFYQVSVTDASGCPPTISAVYLTVGVNSFSFAEMQFSAFPNPGNGKFEVQITNCPVAMKGLVFIDNLLGATVFYYSEINMAEASSQKFLFDISSFPPGQYFLQIVSGAGVFYQEVLIVK